MSAALDPREAALDANFVTIADADRMIPGRVAELRAKAEREGKMLVQIPKASFHGERIAEAMAARDAAVEAGEVKTVSRSNSRALMKNLAAIARGDVVVVD